MEKMSSDRQHLNDSGGDAQCRPSSIHIDHTNASDSSRDLKRSGSEPNHPAIHNDEQQSKCDDVNSKSVINYTNTLNERHGHGDRPSSAGVETCGIKPEPTTVQQPTSVQSQLTQSLPHQLRQSNTHQSCSSQPSEALLVQTFKKTHVHPVVIDDKDDEFDYLEKAAETLVATWTEEVGLV